LTVVARRAVRILGAYDPERLRTVKHCSAGDPGNLAASRPSRRCVLPGYDPTASDFTITLANADGLIYQGTLLPGDIRKDGRRHVFKDPAANRGNGIRSGIKFFSMSRRQDGLWRVQRKAFSDLAAATEPSMTIHLTTGRAGPEGRWPGPLADGEQVRRFVAL
jgi:hypothetical protein